MGTDLELLHTQM